jgi:anthranilate synthase component 1
MSTAVQTASLVPAREAFVAMATQGNVIPVYRELIADTETPVSLFRRLGDVPGTFLLESVEGGEKWASHSFIGLDPFLTLEAHGDQLTITRGDSVEQHTGDPVEALRTLMAGFKPVEVAGLPRFIGGAVGFFGYDTVRFVEEIPELAAPHGLEMPDAAWLFPSTLVVFNNLSHRLQLVHLVRLEPGEDASAAYDQAAEAIARLEDRLSQPVAGRPKPKGGPVEVSANFTQDAYCAAVEQVKEHIRKGDVFQLVLSQRFQTPALAHPFDVYRALRVINPSPYMYYLRFATATVVGASPELLFRVAGETLTVRPIAGTRPRGATPEEDVANEASLLADEKERAEHVMLIDLGRNDVGRVSALGSVRVVDQMVIERYSHVMHLVSSVTGTLRAGLDAFDALKSTFPAGTLSGAPKVRAMQLIEAFEPVKRGLYGGAVGYFSFNGDADLAIAIRTLVATDDAFTFQAGGGIVYDSVPELEYQETLHKSRALRRAIELAAGGLPTLEAR